MHYYKTTIQYEGTKYAGFQWQNEIPTIQSEFNYALSKILDGKFSTTAASRTDTGVHAIHQIVKITSSGPLDCSSFLEVFNKALPDQIKCLNIEPCEGLFRPSVTSQSKEYRYFFTNNIKASKDDNKFIANISNPLDIEAMKICLRALLGKHDFCNFYSSGSNVKSTVRDIFLCELTIINPQDIFSSFELFKIPTVLNNC
jgi:tRNA pseudouridine38-40 synthase